AANVTRVINSDVQAGVMCSNFLVNVTTRATAFCTDCNLLTRNLDATFSAYEPYETTVKRKNTHKYISVESTEKVDTFYHYTDDKGAEGITRDKTIRPSTDPRDMMIGKGVYLTKKNPDKHSKEEILQNNYDSALLSTNPDRVKNFVKIDLPTSKVDKAPGSRDVYKYKGEDGLDLRNYCHEIIKRD
ncbi:uncharacterized protein LOC116296800, partial [Actinia tenebrosa]|uniref:Uncharacterized protein LOC116296800 n=1 Tax=Actinia tenebrosa TaxID=6105 RepID=A0A6P8I6U8_ACTTE